MWRARHHQAEAAIVLWPMAVNSLCLVVMMARSISMISIPWILVLLDTLFPIIIIIILFVYYLVVPIPDKMVWKKLVAKGTAPVARSGHSGTLVANRYLVVFGGCVNSVFLNDVHILDLGISTIANRK